VAQHADREVQIYRRANSEVGVRNELWILPTVGCVNAMARQMQTRFLKAMMLKVLTAFTSSATPTAVRSWVMTH
jgi:altronate dehydratase